MTQPPTVTTKLLPHQLRVVERILHADVTGLVVAHGLGSGKTLTSIAAQEAMGVGADIVVPASLQDNYAKEIKKHAPGSKLRRTIHSLQAVVRNRTCLRGPLLIVDEGHRGRNEETATAKQLFDISLDNWCEMERRIVMTASPFYNHPVDLSPLVNLVAAEPVLYAGKKDFEDAYLHDVEVAPSLGPKRWTSDARPGARRQLRYDELEELQDTYCKYVDVHGNSSAEFPRVRRATVKVPLSPWQLSDEQRERNQAPRWIDILISALLPPRTGRDTSEMNAFLTKSRQRCNVSSDGHSPKLDLAIEQLLACLARNERAKVLVYSTFIGAGVAPFRERLARCQVPFGEFTGEDNRADRKRVVEDYNFGKIRVLLVSDAGGEGLDLTGTRLVQILEPAWNEERIKQVEGRAIRFRSHAHLPLEEQEVEVQKYVMVDPTNNIVTTDQYLQMLCGEKERLIDMFRALLPKEIY